MSRRTRVFGGVVCLLAGFAMHGAAASPMYATGYDGDGMVTVNGERTFIIGTYYHGVRDDARPVGEQLAELKEAGFNLVHTSMDEAVQQAAADAELLTWVNVGTLKLDNPEESAAAVRAAAEKAAGLPAVAILETVDEPAWTWKKAEARVPAEALVRAYPIIKEADPHHILYTNHAPVNLVSTMAAYNAGTDIVAADIYPVNPGNLGEMYALNEDGYQGDFNNNELSQVGLYAQKMRKVAGPNRPVFMVLQGFAWEMLREAEKRDEAKVLYPTYEESRFMAYQSIINGANGIVYWGTAYTPQPSDFWSDLKRVVSEVAGVAPVLATPDLAWPLSVAYHEMGHSVDMGVQWLVKKHEDSLYVFTCNADKNPCKASVTGLQGWTAGTVLEEDRDAPFDEHGDLTDTWQPFEVHVYKLTRPAR